MLKRTAAVLPEHARRRADAQVARHLSVDFAGEPDTRRAWRSRRDRRWTCRSSATCSPTASQAAEDLGVDERFARRVAAARGPAGPEPDRHGRPASGMARGLGHARRPTRTIVTCRICTGCIPATRSTCSDTPELAAAAAQVAGDSRRQGHRLGNRLAAEPVGPPARRRARLQDPADAAAPRADLPQHVRRPSAVPDRRQLRRHLGHRRDAHAEPGARQGWDDDREIELLPALPKAWPTGSVEGLRAKGGFEVDIAWKDGRLTSATLRSLLGTPCRVRYGENVQNVSIAANETYVMDGK